MRRRGLAIDIAGVGMAVATATLPTAIEGLIQATDWRTAYLILGGVVAAAAMGGAQTPSNRLASATMRPGNGR